MIALDTDVLAVYFIFKWDKRFETATLVIDSEDEKAITIVNMLELAGLMAISQGGVKVLRLVEHIKRRRDFRILSWQSWSDQTVFASKALEYITTRRSPFSDALIGWILEDNGVDTLLSWNKTHFGSRYSFDVLTPEEYLMKKRRPDNI